MDNNQAKKLLQRYRMGLCDPDEARVVEKWLDQMASRSTEEPSGRELEKRNREMWQVIVEGIGEDDGFRAATARTGTVFRFWHNYGKLAALLVLVVGLAIGLYSYYGLRTTAGKELTASSVSGTTIQPGSNGAILTLSDGGTVLLDSVGTSRIEDEKSTTIRSEGGVLYYGKANQNAVEETAYNTISTPKARQYNVVLSDGTRVYLNAGSSVRFPTRFGTKAREVQISGEVYFEVAHLEERGSRVPFIVHVGDSRIEVLGTVFNVNAYTDKRFISTTLIEGAVNVSSGGPGRLLRPGDQARVDDAGVIKVAAGINTDRVIAWKNGFFSFENEDIVEVMAQLSRWYDVEVQFEGDPPSETFWGELQRNATLSSVLRVLEKSGMRFAVDGKKVKVLRTERSPKPDG